MALLKIIPVIDLMKGQVVHAREGRREEYQPLRSGLCKGAEPETVVAALLGLHPFHTLYVADLDAIRREGDHRKTLRGIRRRFPNLHLWVDSGIADEATLAQWAWEDLGTPVIGSESVANAEFLKFARDQFPDAPPLLSLDFVGEQFKGPASMLDNPGRYWPERVLAMNLRRVGSSSGPDIGLIGRLHALKPECEVYAAGGVRSAGDLQAIVAAGAAGALIASAFHDGRLGRADLAHFADRKTRAKHEGTKARRKE